LRKVFLIIVILIASVIGGYFVFGLAGGLLANEQSVNLIKEAKFDSWEGDGVENLGKVEIIKEEEPLYSILDGQKISKKEDYILAVVVENEVSSRPQQKGLSKAQVVYEMLAEGGITRYLALYSRELPGQIGPLRSARPYLVELTAQFQAVFLHAGGSDDALKEINRNDQVLGLNGLVYEGIKYFRRDRKYSAPHNLFVQGEDIINNLGVLKWEFDLNKPFFAFSDILAEAGSGAKLATINFSEKNYLVNYIYQEKTQDYQRYVGGKLHLDGRVEVAPEKVGIIFTEYSPYDNEGRLELRNRGEGEFWLLQRGKLQIGGWERDGEEMMKFYDESGQLMKFVPGQIFLEIIDSRQKVEVN
jgi:hypothetical protein